MYGKPDIENDGDLCFNIIVTVPNPSNLEDSGFNTECLSVRENCFGVKC